MCSLTVFILAIDSADISLKSIKSYTVIIHFIRYAQYSHFKIYSEGEYYKLEIDGYEGNAGDSLNDPWYGSNNSPFSTYNR